MTRLSLLPVLLVVAASPAAAAPSPTVEWDMTAGYSTQGAAALANQIRIFGEADGGLRYYVEGAGNAYTGRYSDAFSAAYPYQAGLFAMETYVEKPFQVGRYTAGVRAGRFRTPFGIYGRSDQGYMGFLRAPLIRYGQSYALSNFWIEGGADAFIGTPHFQIEASTGTPSDPAEHRRGGLDRTVRLQGYRGPWILGASYLSSTPSGEERFYHGRSEFYGVDGRWMKSGLQLRGEWVRGTPFTSGSTEGWYVDALLHRPFMGRTTAVVRYEAVSYDRPPFSFNRYRFTAGARVRLTPHLFGQVNLIHQSHLTAGTDNALDVGLTYTVRR